MSVGLDHLPGALLSNFTSLNHEFNCLKCFSGIGEEGSWYPACAPDELSNLRFWNALNGEAWLINATLYGHGDMLIEFLADDVIGVSKVKIRISLG